MNAASSQTMIVPPEPRNLGASAPADHDAPPPSHLPDAGQSVPNVAREKESNGLSWMPALAQPEAGMVDSGTEPPHKKPHMDHHRQPSPEQVETVAQLKAAEAAYRALLEAAGPTNPRLIALALDDLESAGMRATKAVMTAQ